MRTGTTTEATRGWYAALLLSFAVAAAGCAEPPTDRIAAARERVQAVAADGAAYAPQAYQSAQEAMAQLDAELEAQEGRLGFMRSYDRVEELAAAVEASADTVREAVEAEQARLRAEADRATAASEAELTEVRESLEELPVEDLPEDELSSLQADLAAVEESLAEVDALLEGGDLTDANTQAAAALQAARDIGAAIAKAVAEMEAQEAEAAARVARGDVAIPRAVLADGQRLAAGGYEIRPTDQPGPAAEGLSPDSTRWVEFVRGGKVAGRALAVVIPDAEIGEVAKSPPPRNETRVMELKGGEYVRVWLNRGGLNYLVHLPVG